MNIKNKNNGDIDCQYVGAVSVGDGVCTLTTTSTESRSELFYQDMYEQVSEDPYLVCVS